MRLRFQQYKISQSKDRKQCQVYSFADFRVPLSLLDPIESPLERDPYTYTNNPDLEMKNEIFMDSDKLDTK
jgi:hypothetical protein